MPEILARVLLIVLMVLSKYMDKETLIHTHMHLNETKPFFVTGNS